MTDGAHDHPEIRAAFPAVPAAPDLSCYATKAYVDAAIAAAIKPPVTPPIVVPPVITPPPTAGRPWAAAVTTRTVQIPPSIDATGATDVTASLRTFISGLQSGTVVTGGGPTARYRVSGSILLGVVKGKTNLVFDGQGATINNVSPSMPADANSSSNKASTFYWHYTEKPFPTDLAFRNWVSLGSRPAPAQLVGSEFAAAIHVMGGQRIEVDNISGQGHWGDLVTLNENAQQVWVHGCKPKDVGRNNVSVVWASDVLVEDNQFGDAGYCTFDIEPETGSGAITRITYRRNSSGIWQNAFIAVDGANSGQPLSDFVFDDNTSTKNLLSVIGFSGTPKSRPRRVSFQRNHGPAGGSLKFNHVDGLTVKGNDGTLAINDCPSAITS